jgi:uncharacterized protein with gpF-like domain
MYRKEILKTMRLLGDNFNSIGKRAEILANHGQAVKKIISNEYNAAFQVFGGRLLDSLLKSNRDFEKKREVPATDTFDREQNLWIIQNGAAKVTQIVGTTEKQAEEIINTVTAQAVRDGLGEIQTGKLIRESINEVGGQLSRFRGRMIARTEGHNAQMASQDLAVRSTEIPMMKQWVASAGERTRDTHRDANGQIVNMNDAFEVGGEKLMYPGDQRGSAEETINCRCVAVYIPR